MSSENTKHKFLNVSHPPNLSGVSSSSNSLRRPLNDNTVNASNKMRKTTSKIPIARDSVPTLTISEPNRFRQLVNEKKIDLEQLKINATTLRNELEKQTYENFTIQSNYQNLERILNDLNLKIGELNSYKQSSLDALIKNFELNNHQLKLNHQEKLNNLKEDITKQVDKILTEKQHRYEVEISNLNKEIEKIKSDTKGCESDLNRKLIQLKEDQHKQELMMIGQVNDDIDNMKREIENINSLLDSKSKQIEFMESVEIKTAANKLDKFTSLLDQLTSKNKSKQEEISALEKKVATTKESVNAILEKSTDRTSKVHRLQFEVGRMKTELVDQETKRRKLHAQLQDLKGNIRVFCRIRNVSSSSEDVIQYEAPQDINDESKQELVITRSINNSSSNYRFSFDKIFEQEQSNDLVFEELSQLIQCSLDGTNVCVFAYGQTGSGKTFTMSHPINGMIPLSLMKIFNDIEDLKEQGWSYTVRGKFIEIYNEAIVDLLNPKVDPDTKHEIKHDDIAGKTTVTNVSTIDIKSPEQAITILNQANKKRSTAATKSNDHSSRSHSIFIIDLQGYNRLTKDSSYGTLNLIDLAGSERLNNSRAEGDRLKETQAINKSLSCLGDVIHSLNLRDGSHVPYRNSKLTYLLKHSIGGNSKTLMFVNISPLTKDLNETINSLRFATKVNNTRINK
ncbi:kinesin-like protein, putative [Candida dubliniensis CD36]|uniref:Kinesin-like protein n=1 Tax=Candida dubliniensis (strain CD36 / ATCC MYA-646 / CBS 7987 / NCPF 3949 / NRRL Y-17841) TaxID=573826 RepID=B9WCK6_CANDC|nr:kinesin-like protein, putative [Candida dubliniensis CD36]CAX44129.1 kinesin-like protein, putative [Candida dubliniensis CD36]